MTGNTSAVHRLGLACLWQQTSQKSPPPHPKVETPYERHPPKGYRMYNVCKKNVGLRKFWPGLKISDAFLIGLKVLFQVIFLHLVVSNFFADRSRNLLICCFSSCLSLSCLSLSCLWNAI